MQVAGKYIAGSAVCKPSRMGSDDVLAARLWDASMKLAHAQAQQPFVSSKLCSFSAALLHLLLRLCINHDGHVWLTILGTFNHACDLLCPAHCLRSCASSFLKQRCCV